MEEKQKTVDEVMLDRMKEMKVETMYDRYKAQLPQCGYGSLALCCRCFVITRARESGGLPI